ncbi:MAG: ABC transporter substrate-binding protein [Lachnospiraceae bacterium]|nr:ABC transporter substrate-binding protein [Lachnospiraceae bacterium]
MKIKKLLALVLAGAMTATMLVGCGNDAGTTTGSDAGTNTGSNANTSTTTPDAGASTSSDGKVHINVYRASFNVGNPDSAQVAKVQDAINEYIADKINVEISLSDVPSGEYPEKGNLALANNEINLLWTASWETTIGTNDLWKANAVYDISALLPGTTLYESMPEAIWAASRYDGKDLYVPVYKESYEGYDLKFPETYATEFGLDTSSIKELKDLEPYLEWCKTEKGLKYPYLVGKTPMFYRYYLDKYDFFTGTNSLFAIERASNKVVNPSLTQDYLEFCTLMCEWGEKGYIHTDDEVAKVTSDNEAQNNTWGVNWWTCVPGDESNSESRDLQEEVFVEGFTGKYAHSTTTLGSCFAITANSTEEQAKACIDFLGLLYTDTTLADLYTFGIEGEDYVREDGKVKSNNEKYGHAPWESTSVVPVSLSVGEPDDKVQMYVDNNNAAVASCAAGFRFDATPVEAQYAACNNVFDQYGRVLEVGGYASADVASVIEEYNKALDEAGYQDVLAEFSNQYETWKSNQ